MSDFSSTPVLIIGYGNTLRGDDGVGVRIAETIAQQQWPGVRSLICHQLTPELASDLAKAKGVIFVDAFPSDESMIQIQSLYPVEMRQNLGHTEDPRTLLSLSQVLYGCCPPAWWVLIPGSHFEFGEQLSPVTKNCVQEAINLIQELIGSIV
ncbi:hydrogenase maturation protease [Gloeothece citriformis PCC 7424]|uniref:Hydrogenase maturation protease n=1 Tax=Gloeothece citriformis (strain PCC 7424) TaxID=65393 RepID=B7KA83_GLOC7|nr:hydrogenase maturation protease [Gloeothece citriformis]ACK72857.1 hydrogenase maturation protease [Gloeothece citriformis PCC 7424]